MRYLRYALLGLLVLGFTQLSTISPRSAYADSVTIPMGDDLPNAIPGWFCDPSFWLGSCQTTVTVGDSVTWVYPKGGTVHTATACGDSCDLPTGSPIWDSGFMFVGDTFTWTFDTPGAFLYYCTLHPFDMRGTIVVEEQPTPTPTPTPALTPTPAPTSTHTPTFNPLPTPPQAVLPVAEGQSTEVAPYAGQTATSGITLPTAGGTPPRSGSDISPWTLILTAGGLLVFAGVAVLRLSRGGRA